ncbi:MAG: hypothetical protein IJU48_06990 [Synergistaceae bacterium]|nr:hypothetical protein [Synergistaceae bacterium]
MDFVKISGEVTDITIPEGECVKIEEAETERVLWEKGLGLTPEWKIYDAQGFSYTEGYSKITTIHNVNDINGEEHALSLCMTKTGANMSILSFGPELTKKFGYYSCPSSSLSEALTERVPLAVSDDYRYGAAVLRMYKGSSAYVLGRENNNGYYYGISENLRLSINSPSDESKVKIINSPEREEYLITGISGGAFTVPKNFTSSTQIAYSGKNAVNGIWVSEFGKYFASTNMTGASRVLNSDDGTNWQEFKFSITKMKGILNFCWLDNLKKLCAVSDTTAKIAISSDGETWELKDVPFSNALCCAYSPEQKLFCVLDKSCAYITRDLTKWIEAPLPDNMTVNFKEVIHGVDGIFACHEYLSDKLCILTTKYPIR